jgi:integrase/recombinase XerC
MKFKFYSHVEYESYLLGQARADLTIASYMMEMTMFFAWLARVHPNLEVYQIGYQIVSAFIEEEIKSGKQISTVNKKISALKSYFHFLWLKGAIGIDPCAKLRRKKDEREEQAFYLQDEEIDFLLHTIREDAAARKNEDVYLRNMSLVSLFLWGGLRIQEAANLLWREVVWEQTKAIVAISFGNLRRVVLNENEAKPLNEYYNKNLESLFVFPSRQGEKISPRSIQFILKVLGDKSGLHITAQKLRNTFSIQKLQQGYSREEVADFLGIDQLIIPDHVLEEIGKK